MMDNIFDLRNEKFKKYFINKIKDYYYYLYDENDLSYILQILNKNQINESDLMNFYFNAVKLGGFEEFCTIAMFDYKIKTIEKEKYFNFIDYVNSRTRNMLENIETKIFFYDFKALSDNHFLFCEIVDLFLRW